MRLATRGIALTLVTAVAGVALLYEPGLTQAEPLGGIADRLGHRWLDPYARFERALRQPDAPEVQATLDEIRLRWTGWWIGRKATLELARRTALTDATRAIALYREALATFSEPEIWLEVARLHEARGETAAARSAYTSALPLAEAVQGVIRTQPDQRAAAETLARAGRFAEALAALGPDGDPRLRAPWLARLGRHTEALAAFLAWQRLDLASTAASLGRALSLHRLGRHAEAEAILRALTAPEARTALADIALRRGEWPTAVAEFQRAGRIGDLWRAAGLLEERNRAREAVPIYLRAARLGTALADDAAYRAWVLARRFGDLAAEQEAAGLLPAMAYFRERALGALELPQFSLGGPLPGLPAAEMAIALAGEGLREEARMELRLAELGVTEELALLALAAAYRLLGWHRDAQRIGGGLVRAGSTDVRAWREAYPMPWADLVLAGSLERGLDPLFVWSIMREESRFHPQAVSVSNARGLMQVIPSTWNGIAQSLRETPGDPFDPETNIRYGIWYLALQVGRNEGDLERAAAAYNGGPGNLGRWLREPRIQGDNTELLRWIHLDETREYVQKVLGSYAVYRALYPGIDATGGSPPEDPGFGPHGQF